MKTVVKVDSINLPIYETPHGKRKRFTLVWYEAGKRKRKVFEHLVDAKREATDIGVKLANGNAAVLELTSSDRDSYVTAMRELPAGVPLHEAVRQYSAAVAALPAGGSLLEAARAYAKRENGQAGKRPAGEVVEEYIKKIEATQKKGGLSLRYVRTMRSHLRSFAKTFQMMLGSIEPGAINEWLEAVADSPKYFNNIRTSLVTFFGYAREQGILAPESPTAAEKSKRKKLKDTTIGILTPGQLSKLLKAAGAEARLYLAVGAFSGIRVAEMGRLRWENFDFEMGLIRLDKTITKTGQKRNVPILSALLAWLDLYPKRKGKLFSSEAATRRTITFAKEQGEIWPGNCLRHSWCSYRTAATKNQPQVALEAGNSVRMIQRHYDSVVTEREATAWFAILPEAPANVLRITSGLA